MEAASAGPSCIRWPVVSDNLGGTQNHQPEFGGRRAQRTLHALPVTGLLLERSGSHSPIAAMVDRYKLRTGGVVRGHFAGRKSVGIDMAVIVYRYPSWRAYCSSGGNHARL